MKALAGNGKDADRNRSDRLSLLLAALVGLFAVMPFLPAIEGEWVYDDIALIRDNRLVQSVDSPGTWFGQPLFDAPLSTVQLEEVRPFYRPLVVASYALNYQLGDGATWPFHLTNLLIHAAVSVLVFFALQRWLAAQWPAFWAALLFSVHPTKPESVAWISGRPDLLCTLFLLLALEFYVGRRPSPRGRLLSSFGFFLAGAAALLSKETAVLLPAVVAYESYRQRGFEPFTRQLWWRLFRETLPSTLLVAFYAIFRSLILPSLLTTGSNLGTWNYLVIAVQTWGHLAELLLFPHDLSFLGSSLEYRGAVIEPSPLHLALGCLSALILLALGIYFWKQRSEQMARRRLATLTLVVLLLFPVSQVIPIGLAVMTQARFWYLPMLPVLALCALLLCSRSRLWASALLGALALGYGALSFARSEQFATGEALWSYELRQNPNNPAAVSAKVGDDWLQGGAELAMRRAACGFRESQEHYHSFLATPLFSRALEYAFGTEPDGSLELKKAADFLANVRNGRLGHLTGRISLRLDPNQEVARQLAKRGPSSLLREASYRQRYGQPAAAKALLAEAVASCSRCEDIVLSAARTAVFLGEPELARKYAGSIGAEPLRHVDAAISLYRAHFPATGVGSAFELSKVGYLLRDPGFSYRALLPYSDEIEQSRHQPSLMTLALVAVQAGGVDQAHRIYDSLPSDAQDQLDELGMKPPNPHRHEPFVKGTCALSSEL